MTTTLPPLDGRAPTVVQHRWPARLTGGGHGNVRAMVVLSTDPEVGHELWAWVPLSDDPRLIVHDQWIPDGSIIPRDGEGRWTVATPTDTYVVQSAGGCARCSSALGRWKPWLPWKWAKGMPEGVLRSEAP